MDNETARRIFESYSSYVYRTAWFLTGSSALADDITQDTFLKVFGSYESYDPGRPLKPWIYKITLNVIRDAIKKKSAQRTVPLDFDLVTGNEGVETRLFQEEIRAELLKAVNRLSRKSKEIIVLRYFNDMSLREMAESLNIPIGTCKSRLNHAVKQLRKNLPSRLNELYEGGDLNEES
ncbi:sigma-70 family RNA polymerase sigma factor [Alicyclobacillus cycloheptanicus]|uniref:RNA polymerase sigma factor n=1 Tax=Alicyclobacillus cycloheptanicus TaxID=1457 RepID=A0ABT9XMM3_9BACL|nr:sigma-70 family RNA polymerase sigma factor [Alicyclobacillus cycloheptanicus]MDQ0191562.1 RNA polymerase sigma-70 factor (ECF subfamily) [Alicyclobacillus cycloheptanicus]WDM02344.1 sigma-70 family RNA polymerase sigma factor [Alicyclobacillus cycloheptanicus]